MIWLEALLDPVPPPAALVAALAQGWEAVSGTACQPGQLTLAEARHADALMADRYASVAWTLRR